jgi:hypothetical protein
LEVCNEIFERKGMGLGMFTLSLFRNPVVLQLLFAKFTWLFSIRLALRGGATSVEVTVAPQMLQYLLLLGIAGSFACEDTSCRP